MTQDWRTIYENEMFKRKNKKMKKNNTIRLDFEMRIDDLIVQLEKVKSQSKLLNCMHDYAIARESLKDLRMVMRTARQMLKENAR